MASSFSSAELAYLQGEQCPEIHFSATAPTVTPGPGVTVGAVAVPAAPGAVPAAHGSALVCDGENRVLVALTVDCAEDTASKARAKKGSGRAKKGPDVEVDVSLPPDGGASASQRKLAAAVCGDFVREQLLVIGEQSGGGSVENSKAQLERERRTEYSRLFVDIEVVRSGGSLLDAISAGLRAALTDLEVPEIVEDPVSKRRRVVEELGGAEEDPRLSSAAKTLGVTPRRAVTVAVCAGDESAVWVRPTLAQEAASAIRMVAIYAVDEEGFDRLEALRVLPDELGGVSNIVDGNEKLSSGVLSFATLRALRRKLVEAGGQRGKERTQDCSPLSG